MIFSPEPKKRIEDLFGRNDELKELDKLVRKNRIILVTGMRRIGKTSLVNVYLNKFVKQRFALVDVRTSGKSFNGIFQVFDDVLHQLDSWINIKDMLKGVTGVTVFGSGISLSWKENSRANLGEIFDTINKTGKKFLVVLDEAQRLRGNLSYVILDLLAHCYDYCDNIKFIITGSEAGVLRDFIRIDDSQSSLFGRHIPELRLDGFSREKSREFLIRGFGEAGLKFKQDVIEKSFDYLDGVAGWLNEFGLRCIEKGTVTESILSDVFENAVKLEIEEVSRFSTNYILVLEALGQGRTRWSRIRNYLEGKLQRTVNDSEVQRYLEKMIKRGYVEKRNDEYLILDPVLIRYFSKET
jgi:AAA+ ATPase superfamily predicted ATPase